MFEYRVTEHKGENYIARIHKPILTEEEHKRRTEEVKTALVRFAKEKIENEER